MHKDIHTQNQNSLIASLNTLFSACNDYHSENGALLKNKIIDDARAMKTELLQLLLKNENVKNAFFAKAGDVLVFDKAKFARYLDNKEFLPDSFTSYKNKIGLTCGGSSLFSNHDVVLDFPYKDCVLEGGQTKDDQKRSEVFYNEVLAPEQITNLLAPKAFTNAVKYTKDGSKSVNKIEEADNLIIKGNNLIALSSLLERYRGKVKCIYIDPPFNTKSAATTFMYNNTFNNSTWLVFMKNRLEIAKKMLKNNGTIWIAIDHCELFYLGVLADEVFGVENRLGVVTVVTNPGGRQDETYFPTANEFMLVYAKDINDVLFNKLPVSDKKRDEYKFSDLHGKYKLRGFRRSGNNSLKEQRPSLYYPIYYNESTKEFSLEEKNGYTEILPIDDKGTKRCWRWGKSSFLEKQKDYILANRVNNKMDIYVKEKECDNDGEKPKTIWTKSEYTGQTGSSIIKGLFGDKTFSYPKSPFILQDILTIATNPGDLVLDFHLGSGTTAAVAHKMGRQYIGVEQMDYIQTVSVERLKKVISGEQGGISKAQNWTGGGSFVYCELASLNAAYIKKITACTTDKQITSLIEEIKKSDFVSSSVIPSEINTEAKDFASLSLDEKKQLAIVLLDKNQLYINKADIGDTTLPLSKDDKEFTKSFYKDGEN